MEEFGIKEALKTLGIKSGNLGVSTGTKWIKSREFSLESYSPADGKRIGRVQSADEASFNKVVLQSRKAFQEWHILAGTIIGILIGIALASLLLESR